MTTRLMLPKPGMGTEEGTVVRWLKAPGDKIVAGEPLVEIEFEKATQEIEAPVSGRLSVILAAENETVPVNTAIAEIECAD
jgi:pyruvate/2-oxoglutarate dehydrogenase complex dihydrolipoamide acyltransferase (E2) component